MIEWINYLFIGAFAGFMAGLLGIGGGFVIVPALLFLLPQYGVSQEYLAQIAIGTSLATICITSISSLWSHHRQKAILWPWFIHLTPGIIFGAILGAAFADILASAALSIIFASGAIVMGLQILLSKNSDHSNDIIMLNKPQTSAISFAIGHLSALVGIGGGSLVTPLLVYLKQPIQKAVATSAACGLPIAVAGTLGYIYFGWSKQTDTNLFGYIYWKAFLGIILASVAFAPLGAKLAHKIPGKLLKKIFALFLCIIGSKILIQQF